MRTRRTLTSLFILALSVLLMGQANNCADLSKLIPQMENLFGSAKGSAKIHISNLSFMDAKSKSVMVAGDAELINKAVEDGMKTLAHQDQKYIVNAQGRTIPNNDANANKLSEIFWDPNLSRTQKVDKIIADLMAPNQVDGLVAGQFVEDQGAISVRPFVISRADKKLVTESLTFKKNEFECKDPSNPNVKVLCTGAYEAIKDAVIRLLKTS